MPYRKVGWLEQCWYIIRWKVREKLKPYRKKKVIKNIYGASPEAVMHDMIQSHIRYEIEFKERIKRDFGNSHPDLLESCDRRIAAYREMQRQIKRRKKK